MGTVLRFPLERVSRSSNNGLEADHTAQVLLYEGVRYSRTGNKLRHPKAKAKKTGAGKKH